MMIDDGQMCDRSARFLRANDDGWRTQHNIKQERRTGTHHAHTRTHAHKRSREHNTEKCTQQHHNTEQSSGGRSGVRFFVSGSSLFFTGTALAAGTAGFGGRMYRCAMMLRCCLTVWASVLPISFGLTPVGGGGAQPAAVAAPAPPAAAASSGSGAQQLLTGCVTSGGQL